MITFGDYQKKAAETAVYPEEIGLLYVVLGLAGEVGEVCNKVKKVYRDYGGKVDAITLAALADELSDCLWYLSQTCEELELDLGGVAVHNLDKLASRAKRGTLHGSGDNR